MAEACRLVLSIFPGIGLLDLAFEEAGFCVVRGPDRLWGGNIRSFHPPAGVFGGVIGGPPCQCFSRLAAIVRHNGYRLGENLIPEFERVVAEAQPEWFVMENVIEAPIPSVPGFSIDPAILDNRWLGEIQSRKHRFSFGTRDGKRLHFETAALEAADWERRVCASGGGIASGRERRQPKGRDGARKDLSLMGYKTRGYLARALHLQGLPDDFLQDSPLTVAGKIKAIGNGVPLPMGRALAKAVKKALARCDG